MAVAVLLTASCAKEDISSSIGGGEVEVTFSASLPELGTRAYADGTNAGILYYKVFDDATNEALPLISGSVKGSKVFTVNIPMLKGMTYDIVFWAQKEGSDYYDLNGKELTVKFDANKKNANDNDRDAFYAYVDGFNPATAQNEDTQISLYRPFGQLNAATSDFEAVENNGVTLTTSSLKVTTFTKFNLETGIATDADVVIFDATAIPTETLKAGYKYLSMNYLLPGTVDAEYTFKGKRNSNDSEVVFTGTTYTNVPVKANYRTNILGKLLTATTEFTVTIEKDFDEPAVEGPIVTTQQEFNAAIAAGEKLIYFSAGNFTIPGQFNVAGLSNGTTLTLIGAGAETKLSFNSVPGGADGGLNSYADGLNLEFKNMTIVSPNTGSAYTGGFGRALSATFTNCEYYGQYRAVNANTKFEKCTIDPQTSYIYTDYANADFVDCVFNCSKGKAIQVYNDGKSTNTTINVKNCQFTAAEIGYTWDDKPVTAIDINSNGELFTVNINNSTATGFGTGLQSGNNLHNIKGGANYIIIYVDGVCVSAYGLTIVDGYAALFKNDEGDYCLLNKQSLIDWHNFLDANKAKNPYECNVKMLANINADGWTWNSLWIIPDSGNTTGFQFDGQNHTISNLKIAGEGMVAGGLTGMAFKNLTIDGVEVESTGHNAAVFAGSTYSNVSFENVAVKNATVNGLCNTGIFVGGTYEPNNLVISFKNCSVETSAVTAAGKDGQDPTGASGFVGKAYSSTKLVFEGTNSIDDATTITNHNGLVGGKAYGYTIWANGGWASTGASDELVSWGGLSYVSDAAALTEALENGGTVVLSQDVKTDAATTAPYGNKYAFKLDGGILDGNGHELEVECYGDDYGVMTSGGTVKNLTIKEGCRAIMIMHPTEDIILDNVNIGGDGVLYPINTGEAGAEGIKLVVTNSTLAGWVSFSNIASASFTNVEFKQGTYYNNISGRVLKPYVNTTITDCSFIAHMNLDLSKLSSGHKITFKNCTVDGQAINAGVFTVPTTDAQYDTELFTVDLPSWASSINDCIVFE